MKAPNYLVSRKQAIKLKKLGFNQLCSWCLLESLERMPMPGKRYNAIQKTVPIDWNSTNSENNIMVNKKSPFISVPTVYEAIDWIATTLRKDPNILAFDYIGFIYITPTQKARYTELRKIIDDHLKVLTNSRKKSIRKQTKKLSKHGK